MTNKLTLVKKMHKKHTHTKKLSLNKQALVHQKELLI